MAADYAWNLWASPEEGDRAWEDSFSYIEHNSPIANAASDGLRDLSANMRVHRDGGIDGRISDPDYDSSNKWWINHESDWEVAGLNISETLGAAKPRLDAGSATPDDLDAVEKIYGALGAAARNYREGAGDQALFSQMDPFVSSWDETCASALGYVDAVHKAQGGNAEAAREALSAANALYASSQSAHKIDYLGVQKDARVGLVVVTPTLTSLKGFAEDEVTRATSGEVGSQEGDVRVTYDLQVPTRWAEHDGAPAVADGNTGTFCWFQGSNNGTDQGASVTVTYGEPRRAREFQFVQAEKGGDGIDVGFIEYQDLNGDWHKIADVNNDQKQTVLLDEPVDVRALRVTNRDRTAKRWKVYEISLVNESAGPADTTALAEAVRAAKAVPAGERAGWTSSARSAFDAALEAAEKGLAKSDLGQREADALAHTLADATQGAERYTELTAAQLEAAKLPAGSYTASSYATYEAAYRALRDALLDADNLPKAEGERLAAELEASKAELAPDRTAQDRAQLALNDAGQYAEKNYGPKSWGVFAAARDELAAALQTGADAPTYERLTESLEEAIAGLRAPDDPSEVVTPGSGEDPGTGEGEAPGTTDGVENPGTAKPTDDQRPSTPKPGAASKPNGTAPSSAAQSPSAQKAVTSGTASLPQTGDVAMTGIVPIALIGVALATLGVLALRKGFQRR